MVKWAKLAKTPDINDSMAGAAGKALLKGK